LKGKKIPRDSSGTYTLPTGNPVVSGTIISSTWANSTNSDIAQALTDSLDRQGRGAMSAALLVHDGTQAAPGLGFGSEPGSGLRRIGTQQLALDVGGADVLRFNGAGAPTLPGQMNALGRINFTPQVIVTPTGPTVDLGAINAQTVILNGAAIAISSFGASGAEGTWVLVGFGNTPPSNLVYNATKLVLPGRADIVPKPDDYLLAFKNVVAGNNTWEVPFYQRNARTPQGYFGGFIDSTTGALSAGASPGFSCSRTATGIYHITHGEGLIYPVAGAVTGGVNAGPATVMQIVSGSFDVHVYDSAYTLVNTLNATFIAVKPL
jgi:hypothetical protein